MNKPSPKFVLAGLVATLVAGGLLTKNLLQNQDKHIVILAIAVVGCLLFFVISLAFWVIARVEQSQDDA